VLNLTFAPQRRVPVFHEDLLVRYAGETRKLLSLSGSATGFEVMLETDALPFGVVMAGSLRSRKLNFENSGDLPARLKWVEGTFGEHFRISPIDANVPPGSEFAFEVEFQPNAISDDIRQENIMLMVDGGEPLSVTCTGSCVPQPDDSVKMLSFKSLARKEEVQSISISNPTDKVWTLNPVIKGANWKGLDEISVPGNGSVDYQVTYYPLTMTKEIEVTEENESGETVTKMELNKHAGSIFFALPNGSALLYNLDGEAGDPEPENRLSESTGAKEMLTIPLPVKNWLNSPQKFAVEITLADENDSVSTFLSGANQIDVPSNATRDYPLRFFSYKEGVRGAVVKFTNVSSGEYIFFELAVQVSEAGVQEKYKMEAPVRQVAKKIITIDNPLAEGSDVSFAEGDGWWKCDNECVKLTKMGEMKGNKEGTFELQYRPLLQNGGGEHDKAKLEFEIEELGVYKYELDLVAMPTSANHKLTFECPLGCKQTETFTFKVFNGKAGCDFKCEVGKPKFFSIAGGLKVDGCEVVWDGQDCRVEVEFEPEGLGETKDVLVVSHESFGEYRCELIGMCKPQLPQGPFLMDVGGGKDIEFRNIFDEALDFNFVVDDERFVCGGGGTVNIPARSSKSVNVKFAGGAGAGAGAGTGTGTGTGAGGEKGGSGSGNVEAKMSVRCVNKPDIPPWSYYLTGQL